MPLPSWPCAPPAPRPIAFCLIGAVNGDGSGITAFIDQVVRVLWTSSSAVFTVLKALDFDGHWWDADQRRVLKQRLAALELPGQQEVLASDVAAERSRNAAARAYECAFKAHYKESSAQNNVAVLARWWGALAMAWDLIARWEAKHSLRFEQVLMARADILFIAPMPCASYDTNSTFYANRYIPDGFFFMGRGVAERAMQTLRTTSSCVASVEDVLDVEKLSNRTGHCCQALRSWRVSYYIPCYWVREGWSSGLRIATLSVPAFIPRTHGSNNSVVWLNASADTPPSKYRPASPIERGSQHPMDCFGSTSRHGRR